MLLFIKLVCYAFYKIVFLVRVVCFYQQMDASQASFGILSPFSIKKKKKEVKTNRTKYTCIRSQTLIRLEHYTSTFKTRWHYKRIINSKISLFSCGHRPDLNPDLQHTKRMGIPMYQLALLALNPNFYLVVTSFKCFVWTL